MNTTLSTTLRLLRAARACARRYVHLRAALGKRYGDDTPIPLRTVLEVNGLDDTLWALRAVPAEQTAYRDHFARLLAADYAARVLSIFERQYPDDSRPRLAIETARKFAWGKATQADLAVARDAAEVAARDAARDAALAVAGDAAWIPVWTAARDVAWAAARDADCAARAAAAVAGDADCVARAAAGDAAAAVEAVERRWQEQRLRRYLTATRLPRPVPLPRRPR